MGHTYKDYLDDEYDEQFERAKRLNKRLKDASRFFEEDTNKTKSRIKTDFDLM